MIPNPEKNNETLCFVSIVFPITNDNQIASIKGKIESALSELPQVKIELRITTIKNEVPINGMERQPGG